MANRRHPVLCLAARRIGTKCLLTLLSALLASCAATKIEEGVKSTDQLNHSIPDVLEMRFAHGYKQIEQPKYYYESANWVSADRTVEAFTQYTYLLGNYIYGDDETDINELLRSIFEDRLSGIGSKELIQSSEGKHLFVRFDLEDARCLYSRRFIRMGPVPDLVVGREAVTYLGDAQVSGYICDFSSAPISIESMKAFMEGVSTRSVHL